MIHEISRRQREQDDPVDTLGILDAALRSVEHEGAEKVIMRSWRDLHRDVLGNMWHAYDTLRYQQEAKVWQFHEAAKSNFYIRPILARLKQIPKGTCMSLSEAKGGG